MEKKIESDDLYSEINKKINIYNLKYKFRLLDSDILNILKINSKNSYKLIKNYKNLNFLDEVSKYIDKHNRKPTFRVIAKLDIKDENLVKGINFEGLRVIGEPHEFANHYYENGIDEIFYQDVIASLLGEIL